MRFITRRQLFAGLGAGWLASSGLLSALSACGHDTVKEGPRGTIPTLRKDVHLDLRHVAGWPEELRAKIAVHVGGRSYAATPHTEETQRALSRAGVGTQGITHFASDVLFSAIGTQSYTVGVRDEAGVVAPLLAGIHVPPVGAVAQADAGLHPNDDNPVHITTLDDAAVYAVFHSPSLLSLDSDVARTVIAHIQDTDSYDLLVSAISTAGLVAQPPDHEDGVSGWLVGEYLLDGEGQRIPNSNLKGDPTAGDRFQWVPAPEVQAKTLAVVTETLERIHNDASLEGKSFLTTEGVATLEPAAPEGLEATAPDFDFCFPDQGKVSGKRSFTVSRTGTRTFRITVTNPNSLGAMVGMRSFDLNGPKGDHLLGYVPGTYYAGLGAIFGPSKGHFDIELPDDIASVDVFSAAIAARGGDYPGSNAAARIQGEGLEEVVAGLLLSGIVDFLVPMTLLAVGAGGDLARNLTEQVLKKLATSAAIGLLVTTGTAIIGDILKAAGGRLTGEVILENLAAIAKKLVSVLAKALAKGMLATVAVVIAEVVAEGALESAALEALPIVGSVLVGVDLAQTAAELTLQGFDIANGSLLVRSTLEPAHPVTVVVTPESTSKYFPQGATKYSMTVTPEGRLPIVQTGSFDASQAKVSLDVSSAVPLLGTLTIQVWLYDDAGEVVGRGEFGGPNGTAVGVLQQVDLSIEGIAVPIKPSTKLVLDRLLSINATTRAFVKTSLAPTSQDLSLRRSSGLTVSQKDGILGYSFDTELTATSCGDGFVTQAHLLSVVEPPDPFGSFPCGQPSPVLMALALGDGPSCILAATGVGEAARYGVFTFDPKGALPASFAPETAVARLAGRTMLSARMHRDGFLVALTSAGTEVVDLGKSKLLGHPADAELFVRRGSQRGQMSSPVSIAPLRSVHGFALLDQGARRVHAFDFAGNYLPFWTATGSEPSQIPLRKDAGWEYLDIEIDASERVWVLSKNSGAFQIDIYDRSGAFLVSFPGVNALRMAVDRYGDLYTQNTDNHTGPQGYLEPSIGIWSPENKS